LIRIEDLTVDLGEFSLKDVNLEIKRGEYFVVLGPTGAGKSVLLETIAGLYQPKKGMIEINGRDVTRAEPRKRNVSIVYQDYMLFPHLTVRENIEFGLKENGASDLDGIVDFLEMQRILHRKPHTLSGGESQRVALARALVTNPAVLLLDEPLAALDSNTRERIMSKLRQINEKMGITIMHITHDQVEAMILGDRIGVLNGGRFAEVGTPEQIFYKPESEFVARFVGVKNIFEGTVTSVDEVGGVMGISTGNFDLTSVFLPLAEGTHVTACIRPEEIILMRAEQKTSARNMILGKITDLFPTGPLMRVLVAVGGAEVAVDITRLAARDLGFTIGDAVVLTFKATSVHVIV
jgi:molybdopterin-binding protein